MEQVSAIAEKGVANSRSIDLKLPKVKGFTIGDKEYMGEYSKSEIRAIFKSHGYGAINFWVDMPDLLTFRKLKKIAKEYSIKFTQIHPIDGVIHFVLYRATKRHGNSHIG